MTPFIIIGAYFLIGYVCYRTTLSLYVAGKLPAIGDDWEAKYVAVNLIYGWAILLPFLAVVKVLGHLSKKRLKSLKNKKESK